MTDWSQFKSEDFFVPDFEVRVDGELMAGVKKVDIHNVVYRDNLYGMDSFEITINNWDRKKKRYKYSDSDQYLPGRHLELKMGYEGEIGLRLMIAGEITSLRTTFPAEDYSKVVVGGTNVLHKFRRQQWSEVYIEMKDSEIAEMIGGRNGVKVRTDGAAKADEEVRGWTMQDTQYDLVYLHERARRNGYDIFVDPDQATVYFGPTEVITKPDNILKYGQYALWFEPNVSTANQVGNVTVRAFAYSDKERVAGHASRTGGEYSRSVTRRKERCATQPFIGEYEASKLAKAIRNHIAKEMVTGTGGVVGIPELRVGTLLKLKGLDNRFTGDWFVTATQHVYDDQGYRTLFEVRREDLG